MHYLQACSMFTKEELRSIAKIRKLRLYSYLSKRELAHRLFGASEMLNRILCDLNQMRRYRVPIPTDSSLWKLP